MYQNKKYKFAENKNLTSKKPLQPWWPRENVITKQQKISQKLNQIAKSDWIENRFNSKKF